MAKVKNPNFEEIKKNKPPVVYSKESTKNHKEKDAVYFARSKRTLGRKKRV